MSIRTIIKHMYFLNEEDVNKIDFNWIKSSIENFNVLSRILYITSYKLHVNWYNIFPYKLETYKNSILYKNTINDIEFKKYTQCGVLYIGDIYNIHMLLNNVNKQTWEYLTDELKNGFYSYYYNHFNQNNINDIFEYMIKTGILTYISFNEKNTDRNSYCYYTDKYKYFENKEWYNLDIFTIESQIIFAYHFINNRIMYITGKTGSGKSTQVPKLCWYFLKSIFKITPYVLCTEPRKNATEKNAYRVSQELDYNISENNYIIQIKDRDINHSNDDIPHIKYVTDGTLFSNYLKLNYYSIYIIDEAHEHNKYIDILISLLKEKIINNINLKLIILSATIDQDENLYNEYFKNVIDYFYYTRVNIKRKFSISKPQNQKYKITDIYLPEKNYIDIIKLIIKIKKGNILLFVPGMKEIKNALIDINKIIPLDMIALPYYSKLSQIHKNFIENIDINKIKFNKYIEFSTIDFDKNKENFNYKYYIIVSTNIAEASITIPSLNYVIDTGTHKVNIYDYDNNKSNLYIKNISEINRIQRRGRVGRVNDGVVYYTYNKNILNKDNKEYGIVNNNIIDIIYNLFDIIDLDKIQDKKGDFYLIHPNEKIINRDENRKIISINGIDKIKFIIDYLKKNNLLKNNFKKTELGNAITYINKATEFDSILLNKIILYAIKNNLLNEILNIIIFIINYDENKKNNIFLNKYICTLKDIDDFFSYKNIMDKFLNSDINKLAYNYQIDIDYIKLIINHKNSIYNKVKNKTYKIKNLKIMKERLTDREKLIIIFSIVFKEKINIPMYDFNTFTNKMYKYGNYIIVNNSILYIPYKIINLLKRYNMLNN